MHGKLDATKLTEQQAHQQLVSSIQQSPQKFGSLSPAQLLIPSVNRQEKQSDLHPRRCCSSAQINLKNYLLLKTCCQPAEAAVSRSQAV